MKKIIEKDKEIIVLEELSDLEIVSRDDGFYDLELYFKNTENDDEMIIFEASKEKLELIVDKIESKI